jgi:hypothetical protein
MDGKQIILSVNFLMKKLLISVTEDNDGLNTVEEQSLINRQ